MKCPVLVDNFVAVAVLIKLTSESLYMDINNAMACGELDSMTSAMRNQLIACLDECSRGRKGLFFEPWENENAWPEAAQLRRLASALQSLYAQLDETLPLADEFLEMCSMHGEYHPGEMRLARFFLDRIERNEVGTPVKDESSLPWKRYGVQG